MQHSDESQHRFEDATLFLLEELDIEALLTRTLTLCPGYHGATLATDEGLGWQVGRRIGNRERLSIASKGQMIAEIVLYGRAKATLPADLMSWLVLPVSHCLRMAKAERLAHQDCLTGLENRYAFNKAQMAKPRCVVTLDLDFFKAINDTHGHAAGDAVLREAAHRLKRSLRAGDRAFRVGGEEFAVLANIARDDNALCFAERLRQALTGTVYFEGKPIEVSASAGVSIGDDEPDVLLKQADHALYQAKHRGRAQSVVYAED